jgi:hypothetical protein
MQKSIAYQKTLKLVFEMFSLFILKPLQARKFK